jgi:hypothetical protein
MNCRSPSELGLVKLGPLIAMSLPPKTPPRTSLTIGPERPVQPLATQHRNIANHLEHLTKWPFSIDNSLMGAGKTHMSLAVKQHLNLPHLIIVSPAGVEATWVKAAELYNIPITYRFSYEGLTVRRGKVSNDLLIRTEDASGEGENKVVIYHPTELYARMVREGVLVILDEFQKIKNASTENHRAAKCLVQQICTTATTSKVLFLSASPFDDDKQVIDFLKMVNIIRSRTTYRMDYGSIVLTGAAELQAFCERLDRGRTQEVVQEHQFFPSRQILKTCAQLYYDVLTKYLTTAAPVPQMLRTIQLDCKNGYYNMSEPRIAMLSDGIRRLHRATGYNSLSDEVDTKEADWGAITRSLIIIELAKIEIFARKALEFLTSDPNCKVAIMVNFKVPVAMITRILRKYNPLVLDGSIHKTKRALVVSKFQEPNTNHRVIITNIIVGSLGIDLDDTDGKYPRHLLISPGYKAMVLHQATHRVFRANTKSSAQVRFVFGKCGMEETSILNALSRRKDVMKAAVPKQLEFGEHIKFPGEYEREMEEDVEFEIIGFQELEMMSEAQDAQELELEMEMEVENPNIEV